MSIGVDRFYLKGRQSAQVLPSEMQLGADENKRGALSA